jgi:hypothetical protein
MQGVQSKPGIVKAKAAFNKKKTFCTSKLDLDLRKKLEKCYIWSTALCGAETWKVDQEFLKIFETWCWRRIEINLTDLVKNEDVLRRVKEERNILHTLKGGR